MKLFERDRIKEILVISLSNIGDVILTFPVVDILLNDFPQADLSIVVGPKALSLVENNPAFKNTYIFNKQDSLIEKWRWICDLRRTHFDFIVDLRNTAIPLMVPHKYRTSVFKTSDSNIHMKEKHLNRLRSTYAFSSGKRKAQAIHIHPEDIHYAETFLEKEMERNKEIVIVAPGAANMDKRWTIEGFEAICRYICEDYDYQIIFVGDEGDKAFAQAIKERLPFKTVNGCGRLSLTQLAFLMRKCPLVISNDSSPMHLASYLDVPVIGIFGPTNPLQYGPWGRKGVFVKQEIVCPRCLQPEIKEKHVCIEVKAEQVMRVVDEILKK